jgi:hypothetical protein
MIQMFLKNLKYQTNLNFRSFLMNRLNLMFLMNHLNLMFLMNR